MFRNVLLFGLFLGVNIPSLLNQDNLLEEQLNYDRVKKAVDLYDEKWKNLCDEKGLQYPPANLYLRAFKQEMRVELWASDSDAKYTLLKEYPICAISGDLGPKRKEGDKQIPEGFYFVELFNPVSKYHLSMKINYPNKSDKILSNKTKPGNNIFIHGGCKTIGCIPLTNKYISELYVICLKAYSENSKVPVHIFPGELKGDSYEELLSNPDRSLTEFWTSLEPVYRLFEKTQELPLVGVNDLGLYELKNSSLATFE